MNSLEKIFNYTTTSKILLFFFQSIGLLTVKFDVKSKSWKLTSSKKSLILMLSVTSILHFVWNIDSLVRLYLATYKNGRIFDVEISLISAVVLSVICLMIKIIIVFRLQTATEIANKFIRIQYFLNRFHDDSTEQIYKKSASRSMKLFSISFLFWISAVIVLCILNYDFFLLKRLPLVMNFIILHSTVLQYSFLLLLIKEKYKTLNDYLIKMRNFFALFTIRIATSHREIAVDDLQNLCKLHAELSELMQQVSEYFSLPIFFCICQLFSTLIIFSYLAIRPLMDLDDKIQLNYLIYFIRIVETIYLLLILCISATSVVEEVNFNIILFE